jgi:archaellum biogenesis protein FlaJ (TadC family)
MSRDGDAGVDPDLPDEGWNARARDETDQERLDRNYVELLQELRVAQAGVQILFAFLLSLAFTQRFGVLTPIQRDIYIVALVASAVAAALFIAPVAWHRVLFRRRRKHELVDTGNRMALGGLAALLISVVAALLLIVDVALGPRWAVAITVVVALWYVTFWYILPIWSRYRQDRPERSRAERPG